MVFRTKPRKRRCGVDKKGVSPEVARRTDMFFLKEELKELLNFVNRQVFNQIPSLSAIAGVIAGAWVMSTFTASPIKGALAEWGLIEGGTRVVSSGTYKFMAIALPIIATSVTAYVVHKGLYAFREMQIELYQSRSARLSEEARGALQSRLTALENARDAGILSWGEYRAKMVGVYQPFVGNPESRVGKLIMSKVGAKIQ